MTSLMAHAKRRQRLTLMREQVDLERQQLSASCHLPSASREWPLPSERQKARDR